jgi:hypothetical protein
MVNIHNLSYATTFSSLKSFNERGNLKWLKHLNK